MVSLRTRRELLASIAPRYRTAGKKQQGLILDEFAESTGYGRKYAIMLLNKPITIKCVPRAALHRRSEYGADVRHALIDLWKLSDCQCGKLLVGGLPPLMDRLKFFHELSLCPSVEQKLRVISASTIDRLLTSVRRSRAKGLSTTRPGSLLKHQIPVRTFSDWDDVKPGFAEIDLVAHCGGDISGEFVYTLTVTDIATGWVELVALTNRSELCVTAGLDRIRKRLPFLLLGIDCDNGSEFINRHLQRYCEAHKITFTRSRPYRKNDQCYVEQKNGHVVRHLIGYARYEGEAAAVVINRLYSIHRQFLNFFQACRKLTSKVREGAKVKKEYDAPQTPYQRLLSSSALTKEDAVELTTYYESINPAKIHRRLEELGHEIAKHRAV